MALRLNWKEIELLARECHGATQGLFVERILIPERPQFPGGYLKGEWALRLTGRRNEGLLLMSIRTGQPYFAWHPIKKVKNATQATHSPFDLALTKHLRGAKLLECQAIPRERSVVFWFSYEGSQESALGLVLVLIPSAPEALLVTANGQEQRMSPGRKWAILARSKTQAPLTEFLIPDGKKAPADPEIRADLFTSSVTSSINPPEAFFSYLEKELALEAFTQRGKLAEKLLRQRLKQTQDFIRQNQVTLKEAENEPHWQYWGDLLKASLHTIQPSSEGKITVVDFATEEKVEISRDRKLNFPTQVQKFYQNAKRKLRRIQEAQTRLETLQEIQTQTQAALAHTPEPLDWKALEKLERLSGQPPVSPSSPTPKTAKNKKIGWLGKTFLSKDNLVIWVGRSKDENLELTFKYARGNDLWMHVRGRPGAHTVIPIQPGKSTPLETLLDAAQLTLYYSGGENWGKTEVDYTFKKFVKRIKDSSEASYTHNKTLFITPDKSRLQRLLQQGTPTIARNS